MKLKTDSLKIGSLISGILEKHIRTFPIIAEKSADFPFAVYRRTGINPKNTKDIFNYEETISIEIVVCAKTYKQGVELAQMIKDLLENWRGQFEKSEVTEITLTNGNEDWNNDAYIQRLYFNIDLDNDPRKHKKNN